MSEAFNLLTDLRSLDARSCHRPPLFLVAVKEAQDQIHLRRSRGSITCIMYYTAPQQCADLNPFRSYTSIPSAANHPAAAITLLATEVPAASPAGSKASATCRRSTSGIFEIKSQTRVTRPNKIVSNES